MRVWNNLLGDGQRTPPQLSELPGGGHRKLQLRPFGPGAVASAGGPAGDVESQDAGPVTATAEDQGGNPPPTTVPPGGATPKQRVIVDAAIGGSVIRGTLTASSGERRDFIGLMRNCLTWVLSVDRTSPSERRADPAVQDRQDILSMLTVARFEDGSAIDDHELRDQLVTLLLAGHETTATALARTVDLLLHQPAALQRLSAEVDAGVDDTYQRAVIQESLRLRPVVPLAGRRLACELCVDGLTLPAGTDVTPAIWLTHTRPDLYPEPFAFRPERFLDRPPTTYGWIPFGGGVRRCLGAAFAELEMRVVLSTMLRRRVMHAASPHAERATERNVTLSPRHGARVRISHRAPDPRNAPRGRAQDSRSLPWSRWRTTIFPGLSGAPSPMRERHMSCCAAVAVRR